MEYLIQLVTATIGTFGFAAVFNVRGKNLFYATLGGFLTWCAYLIAEIFFTPNEYICGFVGSVILTLYAEGMARMQKTPVTVFIVAGAIPLIPGGALYRSMSYLTHQNWERFGAQSSYALLFAASMSAGITLTTIFFRIVCRFMYSQRRM